MIKTRSGICLRAARPEDASKITPLLIEVGNGLYEFLFGEFEPNITVAQIVHQMVSADKGPYGYQHYLIAERKGRFAGFVNAFPADQVRDQDRGSISKERWNHIAPMTQSMYWESYFLNSIGTLPNQRGKGIGKALIEEIFSRARSLDFQEVTLLVWERNHRAQKLYKRLGFEATHTIIMEPHPMLPKTRSWLMRRKLPTK